MLVLSANADYVNWRQVPRKVTLSPKNNARLARSDRSAKGIRLGRVPPNEIRTEPRRGNARPFGRASRRGRLAASAAVVCFEPGPEPGREAASDGEQRGCREECVGRREGQGIWQAHRNTWNRNQPAQDRKSTRLNSSHQIISYAV